MTREHERLDRLLGLLASEASDARDLRASVMGRLRASGAVGRGRRVAWWIAGAFAMGVMAWVGGTAWMAASSSSDLGELGRRGASWIVPDASGTGATPVRFRPAPRRTSPMPKQAAAPWWRT